MIGLIAAVLFGKVLVLWIIAWILAALTRPPTEAELRHIHG